MEVTQMMVKENLTNSLSNNFKLSILEKYDIDDLIDVKYGNNNELSDVTFKMNDAYNLASEICNELVINGFTYESDLINIIEENDHDIIVGIPTFYYLENPILSNIGPTFIVKLNYIRDFLYEIKAVVKTYGINSLHVELYLNLKISSRIYFYSSKDISNDFNILISSKIINGKIPSFYGNVYEKNSGFLNV
ncbi:MAG: sporulation protein YunB [bacterium]|nr:sporulation protein YunB [bacterium]